MNTDALLVCFKSGASLRDLASLLDVDVALVEQMVREAMAGPSSAMTRVPAVPSSPRRGLATSPRRA